MSIRTSRYAVPDKWTRCPMTTACPYNSHMRNSFDGGSCDEPRTNKGNSDSYCHKMNNKDLLSMLKEATEFWENRQVTR